jgi:hypothetical protein
LLFFLINIYFGKVIFPFWRIIFDNFSKKTLKRERQIEA